MADASVLRALALNFDALGIDALQALESDLLPDRRHPQAGR